jgi:hypothetical protein
VVARHGFDGGDELVRGDTRSGRVLVGAPVGRVEHVEVEVQADPLCVHRFEVLGQTADLGGVNATDRAALQTRPLAGLHVTYAREHDVILGQRLKAGDRGAQPLPAVARHHRQSVAVEESRLGRLGGVVVRVAVKPHQAQVIAAHTSHHRLLAMAVAGQDDGQDLVGPGLGHLAGQLPVEIKARGNLARAWLGE